MPYMESDKGRKDDCDHQYYLTKVWDLVLVSFFNKKTLHAEPQQLSDNLAITHALARMFREF